MSIPWVIAAGFLRGARRVKCYKNNIKLYIYHVGKSLFYS